METSVSRETRRYNLWSRAQQKDSEQCEGCADSCGHNFEFHCLVLSCGFPFVPACCFKYTHESRAVLRTTKPNFTASMSSSPDGAGTSMEAPFLTIYF
jgi:hypothetical protein